MIAVTKYLGVTVAQIFECDWIAACTNSRSRMPVTVVALSAFVVFIGSIKHWVRAAAATL